VTTSADNPNDEAQQRFAAAERHAKKAQTRFEQAEARLHAAIHEGGASFDQALAEFSQASNEQIMTRQEVRHAQPFTAVAQCPDGHWGVHLIYRDNEDDRQVYRQCTHDGCEQCWRQAR
jgi:hypothetical protein